MLDDDDDTAIQGERRGGGRIFCFESFILSLPLSLSFYFSLRLCLYISGVDSLAVVFTRFSIILRPRGSVPSSRCDAFQSVFAIDPTGSLTPADPSPRPLVAISLNDEFSMSE